MMLALIPVGYTESVVVNERPAYTEQSFVSYVDVEGTKRCKEEITVGPGLAPTAYRDGVVCYTGCSKKRYRSQVDYDTRMKVRTRAETYYIRPNAASKSFVSFLDYYVDGQLKSYKSTVHLKPKTYTSEMSIPTTETTTISKKQSREGLVNGMNGHEESRHTLTNGVSNGYHSETEDNSDSNERKYPEVEIVIIGGGTPSKMNGFSDKFSKLTDTNENSVKSPPQPRNWRSGPFLYNVPERKSMVDELLLEEGLKKIQYNGDILNGYHGYRCTPISGYYSDSDEPVEL